jgi:hypothetical protein
MQQASATMRWTGSWYEALVAVDERGIARAESELLVRIAAELERYRRIGHDLDVEPADEVALDIAVCVCVRPLYLVAHVLVALIDAFSNRVLPGGGLGFFHPDQLVPGTPVAVSRIVAVAQAIEGVESVEVTKLRRTFDAPGSAPALPADGLVQLAPWEVARCDSDRAQPDLGAITFDMRGGR